MGTLKIESLNVKQLIIGGKEYRPLATSEMYSEYLIGDEKYVIGRSKFTNNSYTITRDIEDNNIFKYKIRALNDKTGYTVTKTSNRTFVYYGNVNPLGDNSYVIINDSVHLIQSVTLGSGFFTYTLENDFTETYTTFIPVEEIMINGEQIPISYIEILENNFSFNIFYDEVYCDLREMNINKGDSINTIEIDLYTSLSDESMKRITWEEVSSNSDISLDSVLLISNQYAVLDGQTITLDNGSKWVIN